MNKKFIIGNWKMNPSSKEEAKQLFSKIRKKLKNLKKKNLEIAICPPFVYLSLFKNKSILSLGAQDVFWEEKGAFTGEISPLMLKDLGCKFVIIGHSERRKLGETNEMIRKKIEAARKFNLMPILCIGSEEKDRRLERKDLLKQLKEVLKKIKRIPKIIFAYEPVWAIGTGKAADPLETNELIKELKDFLKLKFSIPNPIFLYGGSVNSTNAISFISKEQIEGLLIGGASLKPEEFIKIIRQIVHAN